MEGQGGANSMSGEVRSGQHILGNASTQNSHSGKLCQEAAVHISLAKQKSSTVMRQMVSVTTKTFPPPVKPPVMGT